MASPSLMDALFQRTLDDIIKGLRQNPAGESAFISKAMEEIRREIKSTDLQTKSIALCKLTYLNSIHFVDMSWAAFHAVECISSPNFSHKKVGYLAISQSFNESTPVILLITNQLRKDLKSNNEFEVSLALECLARIGTVDLCRDLTPDVFTLMSSSKIFVRKKATGLVLRVFEKYPDAARLCFKRLFESLECSDPQIMSAVVGVFCELASKDPRSYLPLAPEFYKILVDSRNNWVLIKVLKIFAKLAPLEPRLAKKVVEPICEHMRRTGAKSLMFECIRTVVTGLSEYESAVRLAAAKIRELLVDDDPNLKYLGLHALSIMATNHLWAVLENKEVVIKYLSDGDPNIKVESLRLVMAMVSEDNVVEICRVLVNYALKSDPEFCNEILGSILSTCSQNVYEIIVDFDWYVSLLGEMARVPHCQKGEELENQLIDIGMRVKDARPELVRVGRDLLIDPALPGNPFLHRILSAAAWVCGEYVEFSRNPIEVMEALLQPRTSLLPSLIRSVYVQSAFKVLTCCLQYYLLQRENNARDMDSEAELASKRECPESSNLATDEVPANHEPDEGFNPRNASHSYVDLSLIDSGHGQTSRSAFLEREEFTHESIVNVLNLTELALRPLAGSYDVEMQARARNVLGFVELIKDEILNSVVPHETNSKMTDMKASKIVNLVQDAFSGELGPVSVSAQERVPIPDGLILEDNLSELEAICGSVEFSPSTSFSFGSPHNVEGLGLSFSNLQSKGESDTSGESTSLLAEHRKRHGLYYLPPEKNESAANDYPPANDPNSCTSSNPDAQDLVKLTDRSLIPKRKQSHAKPRPVVVKLDDVDAEPVIAKKPETKADLLSGAVRDILLGSDGEATTSLVDPLGKSSGKRKCKEKLNIDLSESKGKAGGESVPDQENPGSRKSRHRSHGKDRNKKSAGKKNVDEGVDNGEKEKQKGKHRHGRQKSRQKADEPLIVVEQTPVVPDFLL